MKKLLFIVGLFLGSLTMFGQTITDRENYVEIRETIGGPTVSYPKKDMLIGEDGLFVWGSFGDKQANGSYVKLFLLNPTDFGYSSASTGLDSLRRYMSDMINMIYNDSILYEDDTENVDTLLRRIYTDTAYMKIWVNDGDSVKSINIVNP